jgi:hypothetical protein
MREVEHLGPGEPYAPYAPMSDDTGHAQHSARGIGSAMA